MGTSFSTLMGTTFSTLMGTAMGTAMGTTMDTTMGTTMGTTLFAFNGDHLFFILARAQNRTEGASILPELRTANTGDIAVVVAIVISLTISHVGMKYFSGLFELCCASPVYAPQPLVMYLAKEYGNPSAHAAHK